MMPRAFAAAKNVRRVAFPRLPEAAPAAARTQRSQRAQEIQQILLILVAQAIELRDHGIAFRTGAGMRAYGGQQPTVGRTGTPVVQEEDALAYAPQRRRAEIGGTGGALRDAIG